MVSLKTAFKEGLEQATKHVDGVKHGFRQFDHQLRSTVQGVDNHFKQVLNQVDEFGQSVLTKVDDFGKQLDILINHQLIVLAENFKPIAQQIDKDLTKVRDFIYPNRESVLVPVGGPKIDSAPVTFTHNSLDDFISSRQAYVERIEQTREFSLNGGDEVGSSMNRLSSDADDLIDDIIRDGSHFDEFGNLKPNVTYQAGEFEYIYKTDELGRLKELNAEELRLTDRDERLKHDPNTTGKIKGVDHAGHLAGDRFGGSPNYR